MVRKYHSKISYLFVLCLSPKSQVTLFNAGVVSEAGVTTDPEDKLDLMGDMFYVRIFLHFSSVDL
jgi:hypothetical protein